MTWSKMLSLVFALSMVFSIPGLADVTAPKGIPPKEFFWEEDGTPAVRIVVGEKAAAADVVSAANIAAKIGNLASAKGEMSISVEEIEGGSAEIVYDLTVKDSVLVYYEESLRPQLIQDYFDSSTVYYTPTRYDNLMDYDDDGDGSIDEDPLNYNDDDGDGREDEDMPYCIPGIDDDNDGIADEDMPGDANGDGFADDDFDLLVDEDGLTCTPIPNNDSDAITSFPDPNTGNPYFIRDNGDMVYEARLAIPFNIPISPMYNYLIDRIEDPLPSICGNWNPLREEDPPDSIDNDGDGLVDEDYPGIDNDGDGSIDEDPPYPTPGVDDDLDGSIDEDPREHEDYDWYCVLNDVIYIAVDLDLNGSINNLDRIVAVWLDDGDGSLDPGDTPILTSSDPLQNAIPLISQIDEDIPDNTDSDNDGLIDEDPVESALEYASEKDERIPFQSAYNVRDPYLWPDYQDQNTLLPHKYRWDWMSGGAICCEEKTSDFLLLFQAKQRTALRYMGRTVDLPFGDWEQGDPYIPFADIPHDWATWRPDLEWYGSGWDLSLLGWSFPPVERIWVMGSLDARGDPFDWTLHIPVFQYSASRVVDTNPLGGDGLVETPDVDNDPANLPDMTVFYPEKLQGGIAYFIDLAYQADGIYGAREGDEVTILGGDYIVVDTGPDDPVLCPSDDEIWIAKVSVGYLWVKTGQEVQIGQYSVKVVDVNLFEQKAVVQLYKDDVLLAEDVIGYNVNPYKPNENVMMNYNNGEVVVIFGTALVGAEGIVEAKILIGKDAYKLRNGRPFPGDPDWTVYFQLYYDDLNDECVLPAIVFGNNINYDDTTLVEGPADSFVLEYTYSEFDLDERHINVGKITFKVKRCEDISLAKGEKFRLPFEGNPSAVISMTDLEIGSILLDIDGETYAVAEDEPIKLEVARPVDIPETITLLDSEVTEEVMNRYNLILIGGPKVNKLVAELRGRGKSTVAYEELGYGNGAIEWIKDAFVEGKDVLIVAGYDRTGTRAAARELIRELEEL